MLAWYRRLIALRRDHPSLRDAAPGSTKVHALGSRGLRIERGTHALVVNLSDQPLPCEGDVELASVAIDHGRLSGPGCAVVRR
jgi:hypothetical protein